MATFNDFKYRLPVVISPGEDVTGGQVCIEFDATTFDYTHIYTENDLAVFDDAGNPLPFWRERWREGASEVSRLWILAGDLTSGVDKTIYLAYGNPGWETALDDGASVFEFFDDFDEIDLTRWDFEGLGEVQKAASAVRFMINSIVADWWEGIAYDAPRIITRATVIPAEAILGTKFSGWTVSGSNCHGGFGEYLDPDNAMLFGRQYTTEERIALDEIGTAITGTTISAVAAGYLWIQHSTSGSDYYFAPEGSGATLIGSATQPASWGKICFFLKTWSAVTAAIEFEYVYVAKKFNYSYALSAEEQYNVLPPASPTVSVFIAVPQAPGFYACWDESTDPDLDYIILEVNINETGWLRYQDDGTLGTDRDYMKFRKSEGETEPAGWRFERHISIRGLSIGDTVQIRLAAVDTAGNQSDWVYSDVVTIEPEEQDIYLPVTLSIRGDEINVTVEVEK